MSDLISHLENALGAGGVLTGADVSARSAGWARGACEAKAVLRPRSTHDVSAALKLCHQHGQAVVTEGGKTGLVLIQKSAVPTNIYDPMGCLSESSSPCRRRRNELAR